MSRINYNQICSNILENLSLRQKEIISRRFALLPSKKNKRETLESIGKDFDITRERVRQIERDGLLKLQPKIKKYRWAYNETEKVFKKNKSKLLREEKIFSEVAKGNFKKEIYFLLSLNPGFERMAEKEDFYAFWTINKESWPSAKKIIEIVLKSLEKEGKPILIKEFFGEIKNKEKNLTLETLISYLDISKKIKINPEGFFGLKDWPEINPRRIKDKAYLIFKKEKKPLHFSKVAEFIDSGHFQTVHNELIKDSRFVLVGRGTYALREWGYQDGTVKEVISNILKESKRPLTKEEIVRKTLDQRIVKENTVFLSLSDKKFFLKDQEGFYKIREA
jgi:hypothetical protein